MPDAYKSGKVLDVGNQRSIEVLFDTGATSFATPKLHLEKNKKYHVRFRVSTTFDVVGTGGQIELYGLPTNGIPQKVGKHLNANGATTSILVTDTTGTIPTINRYFIYDTSIDPTIVWLNCVSDGAGGGSTGRLIIIFSQLN